MQMKDHGQFGCFRWFPEVLGIKKPHNPNLTRFTPCFTLTRGLTPFTLSLQKRFKIARATTQKIPHCKGSEPYP